MVSFLHHRIDGYVEIPAIPALEYINQLTVAVCIRGHSKRAPLLEFNAVSESFKELSVPNFRLMAPHALHAHPGSNVGLEFRVAADISEFSNSEWVHGAFTMSEQTLALYANGEMKESESISGMWGRKHGTHVQHPRREES